MSNTIYLYLKTHNRNRTGLKYFGMTKQDPEKYMGSGKRWRNHLSKHGNDVTTEIVYESKDKSEIAEVGKHYSKLWNIVESNEFANLKIEEGDGGFEHINGNEQETQKRLNALRAAAKEGKCGGTKDWTEETYKKIQEAGRTSFLGKHHTDDAKKRISEANKINQKGENNSLYGKICCVRKDAKNYKKRKFFLPDEIPNEWISCKEHRRKNKSKSSPAYGRGWYNDGKKNYFLKQDDPLISELGLERKRILRSLM